MEPDIVEGTIYEPVVQPALTKQLQIREDRKVTKRQPTHPTTAPAGNDRDASGEKLDSLVQDIVGSIHPDSLIHLTLPK